MENTDLPSIAGAFCPRGLHLRQITPLGEGNINDTFLVGSEGGAVAFVLQKINRQVFPQPEAVIANSIILYRHLSGKQLPLQLLEPQVLHDDPERLFLKDGEGDYWRAFRYIPDTVSYAYASEPGLAFEASRAMAFFLGGLWDVEAMAIQEVIPHFHDGVWRFHRFEEAVQRNLAGRIGEVEREVVFALGAWEVFRAVETAAFPQRIVHNDAKMGNFLFDNRQKKALAVIDWDTTMPGAIVSDFGDMVRTMTASLPEDDDCFEQVVVRKDWFEALVRGFVPPLRAFMSSEELEGLLLGAKWIILEQMIRFLGDYLNGDTYYKVRFPQHNLVRARNQMALYRSLAGQEKDLARIIRDIRTAYL
ncbi:MAG: hypothetical protein RL386_963 [Bacteroidota bacterium]